MSSLVRHTDGWWLTHIPFDILATLLSAWKINTELYLFLVLVGFKLQLVIIWMSYISILEVNSGFPGSWHVMPLKLCLVSGTTFPWNHVWPGMKKTLKKSVAEGKLPKDTSYVCLHHCFIPCIQHWEVSRCLHSFMTWINLNVQWNVFRYSEGKKVLLSNKFWKSYLIYSVLEWSWNTLVCWSPWEILVENQDPVNLVYLIICQAVEEAQA